MVLSGPYEIDSKHVNNNLIKRPLFIERPVAIKGHEFFLKKKIKLFETKKSANFP